MIIISPEWPCRAYSPPRPGPNTIRIGCCSCCFSRREFQRTFFLSFFLPLHSFPSFLPYLTSFLRLAALPAYARGLISCSGSGQLPKQITCALNTRTFVLASVGPLVLLTRWFWLLGLGWVINWWRLNYRCLDTYLYLQKYSERTKYAKIWKCTSIRNTQCDYLSRHHFFSWIRKSMNLHMYFFREI